MKSLRTLLIPSVAFSVLTLGCGMSKPLFPVHADTKTPLQIVLDQLDAASKSFKNAQADVLSDVYTRSIKAHDTEPGSIYVERSGGATTMGAITLDPGTKAPTKIVAFNGSTFQLYTVGTNQVDVFKATASQAKYDSFLTLGFGGSGTDLAKNWTINDQGPETIDGVKTEKLDLVSKDPSVSNLFSHVTIWVDPTRAVSLKQIFFAPSGDNRTATYTNIKLNSSINKKPYAISNKATRISH